MWVVCLIFYISGACIVRLAFVWYGYVYGFGFGVFGMFLSGRDGVGPLPVGVLVYVLVGVMVVVTGLFGVCVDGVEVVGSGRGA